MMIAMPISTMTCWLKLAVATVPKVMTIISADNTKSVRIAPTIFSFSETSTMTLSSWPIRFLDY
jgi:hypothetical protein